MKEEGVATTSVWSLDVGQHNAKGHNDDDDRFIPSSDRHARAHSSQEKENKWNCTDPSSLHNKSNTGGTIRDPFGLARWRRLSSMSSSSVNGDHEIDAAVSDSTGEGTFEHLLHRPYSNHMEEQWEEQDEEQGDNFFRFIRQVQEGSTTVSEFDYDRALALSKMNSLMQSRRIQKRAAMYKTATSNNSKKEHTTTTATSDIVAQHQQQRRPVGLTLETLMEVDNETDGNTTPASSNYSHPPHLSLSLSGSSQSHAPSSTRRHNEDKDENYRRYHTYKKDDAAALVTPDTTATSSTTTASSNDSLWQRSTSSPTMDATPNDVMQPIPQAGTHVERTSSTSLRLNDCTIRAELDRIQRELKDYSRFSASSLWTSRGATEDEEVATIVTMDSSVTNLLDDSVLNALHPLAVQATNVHEIQQAGRTHWDTALGKGSPLEEAKEDTCNHYDDGTDESMTSFMANDVTSTIFEDDASSVGDLHSVATRGTVIGEDAKGVIRARKALLREVVVCGGPHNLHPFDRRGKQQEGSDNDLPRAGPPVAENEKTAQVPSSEMEANNVSTVSALSPASLASSSATRPLRTTLILTVTSNLPNGDKQREEEADEDSKDTAPSPGPSALASSSRTPLMSAWIRKHVVSQYEETPAADTDVPPQEEVLRAVTAEEYDAAPRVVKMQVSLEDVVTASQCLNDFFRQGNEHSLEESRACAILRQHQHFEEQECKTVLLSLCHWKRLAMFTASDGKRHFVATQE